MKLSGVDKGISTYKSRTKCMSCNIDFSELRPSYFLSDHDKAMENV